MYSQRGQDSLSLNWLRVVICAASLLGACSSADGSSTAADGEALDEAVESLEGTVETEVLAEADTPRVPGAPLNRFDLQIGQCFNEGSWFDEQLDRRVDLTASVECSVGHQSEVYFEAEFPAETNAPFPGETKMTEWSTQVCYDQFESFVGIEYEVSTFDIGFVQPTQDTFEHSVGQHRRVFCYVYDITGTNIEGTAEGSGL